jgi:transcriptional regulator with XRE-family HTH domain
MTPKPFQPCATLDTLGVGCHYPVTMFNGERMRSRREALGLTRAELARKIEESESRLGQWERAEHSPRDTAIVKIAKALSVSADYLLGLTDEADAPAFRGPSTAELPPAPEPENPRRHRRSRRAGPPSNGSTRR